MRCPHASRASAPSRRPAPVAALARGSIYRAAAQARQDRSLPVAALSATRHRLRYLPLRHPRGLAHLPMSASVEQVSAPRLLRRQNIAPLILVNLGIGLHATIWYMATTAMPSAV